MTVELKWGLAVVDSRYRLGQQHHGCLLGVRLDAANVVRKCAVESSHQSIQLPTELLALHSMSAVRTAPSDYPPKSCGGLPLTTL